MALKTFVKVGNITNLSDARYCAGMGVDLLGFCFDKDSDQFTDPEAYKEIAGWLSGPKFVGEFETNNGDEILDIKQQLDLDYIQLDDIELANSLANSQNVIYHLKLSSSEPGSLKSNFEQLSDNIKYILIELDGNNSELENEIEKLAGIYPILKGYDILANTVASEVAQKQFAGISLKGSQEIKPGFKDYDELADILEALEDDD
ncbi:MAG: phosphoribosylanthranilate isomerase [Bacteroidia bacterium]|jgi:phosphoribosylanthranilate isomerase